MEICLQYFIPKQKALNLTYNLKSPEMTAIQKRENCWLVLSFQESGLAWKDHFKGILYNDLNDWLLRGFDMDSMVIWNGVEFQGSCPIKEMMFYLKLFFSDKNQG